MYMGSLFPTFLTMFVICAPLDDKHSDRCKAISYVLDLNFTDCEQCWEFFLVSLNHLHFLTWKISVQLVCSLSNRVVFFKYWVVEVIYGEIIIMWYCCCSVTQSCLTLCNPMDCSTRYMWYINPLLGLMIVISFVNIFSHSIGCAFVLSIAYFAVQKLFS